MFDRNGESKNFLNSDVALSIFIILYVPSCKKKTVLRFSSKDRLSNCFEAPYKVTGFRWARKCFSPFTGGS